jgi:hypothetical protein
VTYGAIALLALLDYLSGSRDPAGGYRNAGDGAGVVKSAVTEYFVYDGDSLATNWTIAEWSSSAEGTVPFGPDPATDAGQIVL